MEAGEIYSFLSEDERKALPGPALELYREIYESVWNRYRFRKHRRNDPRGEVAHRIAWSQVRGRFIDGSGCTA